MPGPPDPDLGGDTVDEAVANAEDGSSVEEIHTPADHTDSGQPRVDRIRDVEGLPGEETQETPVVDG